MSHYTKLVDVRDLLDGMKREIKVGPKGEGQDWINTFDAMIEDLEDVIDDLEPTEEEQGLIPIPAGYNEA